MVPVDTGKMQGVGAGEELLEALKGVKLRCVTQPTPLRSARVRHRAQVARARQHSHTLQGRVRVRLSAFCP